MSHSFRFLSQGILEVSAQDKGTGKAERITITAEKGRLSEEEIERLVEEAKEYAEEDRLVKERIDSRNGLESYLYSLKNSLEDDSISENMPPEDKKDVMDLIDEALDWMDDNPEASKEEYDDHKKEVKRVATPLMRHFYGGSGSGATGDDEEFYDADL